MYFTDCTLESAEPERDGMPPKFVLSPNKTVEACITCSARMECKAIGDPKPDIRWYNEKLQIVSNDKCSVYTDDGGVCALIVQDVTYEDEGTYKAIASNDFGKVTCSTKLIIKGKQSFNRCDLCLRCTRIKARNLFTRCVRNRLVPSLSASGNTVVRQL